MGGAEGDERRAGRREGGSAERGATRQDGKRDGTSRGRGGVERDRRADHEVGGQRAERDKLRCFCDHQRASRRAGVDGIVDGRDHRVSAGFAGRVRIAGVRNRHGEASWGRGRGNSFCRTGVGRGEGTERDRRGLGRDREDKTEADDAARGIGDGARVSTGVGGDEGRKRERGGGRRGIGREGRRGILEPLVGQRAGAGSCDRKGDTLAGGFSLGAKIPGRPGCDGAGGRGRIEREVVKRHAQRGRPHPTAADAPAGNLRQRKTAGPSGNRDMHRRERADRECGHTDGENLRVEIAVFELDGERRGRVTGVALRGDGEKVHPRGVEGKSRGAPTVVVARIPADRQRGRILRGIAHPARAGANRSGGRAGVERF